MGVGFRPMRSGQEDAVAAMIRQLPKDLGHPDTPKVTGESLRDAAQHIRVTVAEDSGLLLGCCVWMPVYSTWRGSLGVYITDLYVMAHARSRKIGERLIKTVARQALDSGATYLRLEVDDDNTRASAFYERMGFVVKKDQHNSFIEVDALQRLAGEDK
jgi:ribosomal protein S18 acetylase RimI-like enzyme